MTFDEWWVGKYPMAKKGSLFYVIAKETYEFALEGQNGTCTWTEEEDGTYWATSCGDDFIIHNGTPTDNDMVYCPYCGKKIEERKE